MQSSDCFYCNDLTKCVIDNETQEELRAPHESQHGDAVMEAIVKARNGSVLGKGSILKMYFFPGQRTSSHIQIHGAPHVYKVYLHV